MDRRKNRLPRRFAGLLCARMPELQLHRVGEPRRQHQVAWRLDKLLGALVVAMCAGCKSLAEVEQWSILLAPAARRLLGVRLLARAPVLARTVDVADNRTRVIREVSVSGDMAGFLDWGHLSTVVRVRKQTTVDGVVTEDSDRYWLSSLATNALSPEQWLLMARNHWGVENETHNTLDVPLCEDTKPWVTADPTGFLAVLLLRRIAYNILAFFRRVTLRSEENRLCPWKVILRQFDHMSQVITAADVENLRNQGRVYTCV